MRMFRLHVTYKTVQLIFFPLGYLLANTRSDTSASKSKPVIILWGRGALCHIDIDSEPSRRGLVSFSATRLSALSALGAGPGPSISQCSPMAARGPRLVLSLWIS